MTFSDTCIAVKIPAGEYKIGSSSIPNASPIHRRSLSEFWIDKFPVSFAHLERFICGNGFDNLQLWDGLPVTEHSFRPGDSIDTRCEQIYQSSVAAVKLLRGQHQYRSESLHIIYQTS